MNADPIAQLAADVATVLAELRRVAHRVELLYSAATDARERIATIEGRLNRLPCTGTGEHCPVEVPQ